MLLTCSGRSSDLPHLRQPSRSTNGTVAECGGKLSEEYSSGYCPGFSPGSLLRFSDVNLFEKPELNKNRKIIRTKDNSKKKLMNILSGKQIERNCSIWLKVKDKSFFHGIFIKFMILNRTHDTARGRKKDTAVKSATG